MFERVGAQTTNYIGCVIDSNNIPLKDQMVQLISKQTLLKTEFTDSLGLFKANIFGAIDSITLIIHSETHRSSIFKNILPDTLITYRLQNKNEALKEVNVYANQLVYTQKNGKFILNTTSLISNNQNTLYELIIKSPGITISSSGEIKLRGKAGVMVYFDGKPSYLTGTDLENYLKSIPAQNVKEIEFIYNPGAIYDAAGNGGIINVINKRNSTAGLNGFASFAFNQGRYSKSNSAFNLNYTSNKLSLSTSISHLLNNQFQDLTINRNYTEAVSASNYIFNQNTYLKVKSIPISARLGVDVFLTKKSTIGISIKSMYTQSENQKSGQGTIRLNAWEPDYVYAGSKEKNALYTNNYNVNYRLNIDSIGTKWVTDLDYIQYGSKLNQDFTNETTSNQGKVLYNDTQQGLMNSMIQVISLKTDLNLPLKPKGNFELGLKSTLSKTKNNALYTIVLDDSTYINKPLSNNYNYEEWINAAYVNYNTSFKKLNLQTGLRAEHTFYNAKQYSYLLIKDTLFGNSYFNLFPTIFIDYKFDSAGKHVLALDYGRRITRPTYRELTPFVSPLDRFTFYTGNPYLSPSFMHNINLAYNLLSKYFFTISYSKTKNQTNETIQIINGTYYSRPNNLGQAQIISLSAQGVLRPFNRLNSNYVVELANGQYKSKLYNQDLNSSGTYIYFNLINSISVFNNWRIEISSDYLSDVTEAQFVIGDYGTLNFGLQKTFLKNKLNCKISVNDILYSFRTRGTINNLDAATANWYSVRDTRVVGINLSYRFGLNNKINKVYQSSSTENELKRIK
jgi:hypothetical protein